jgi:hypothetical protein
MAVMLKNHIQLSFVFTAFHLIFEITSHARRGFYQASGRFGSFVNKTADLTILSKHCDPIACYELILSFQA